MAVAANGTHIAACEGDHCVRDSEQFPERERSHCIGRQRNIEDKRAWRDARSKEIQKELEKELSSLDISEELQKVGQRERVLPAPRPPPPVPKPPKRIADVEMPATVTEPSQMEQADANRWGRRAWSPARETLSSSEMLATELSKEQCIERDAVASGKPSAAASPTICVNSARGLEKPTNEQLKWERAKDDEQKAVQLRAWKAAAVEREEAKSRLLREQNEAEEARRRAEKEAAFEARAKHRPCEEALLRAAEAVRAQRACAAAEEESKRKVNAADAERDAFLAEVKRRKEELERRVRQDDLVWAESLQEERQRQEESHREWIRDREAKTADLKCAMSAVEEQRRAQEQRTKNELERLERIADERRTDLEEQLRQWAEQHQRAAETQSSASASFMRNFKSSIFVESDADVPHGKPSQPSQPSRHRSTSSDKSGRGPRVHGAPSPSHFSPGPQRMADPLQDAMRDVADRLRACLDLPADKRKAVLTELRLRWHPDKNPDNVEVATKVFQFIQELKGQLWS